MPDSPLIPHEGIPISDVERRPFRILALDGGGIRGYYTAKLLAGLLKHFERSTGRTNLDIGKGFNLIAGTSTGGILGCALAVGERPETIANLYLNRGPEIFPERFPSLGLNLKSALWFWRHRNKPTAAKDVLEFELDRVFGDATLEDLWKSRGIALTLPAVSIETYGPKVFKTPHIERFTHDRSIRLSDACLATASAPLYFPLHQLGTSQGYYRNDLFVDGGLWANNPSMVGLLEAIEFLIHTGQAQRPIHIFSLGTCAGTVDQAHLRNNPNGGLITWGAGKDLTELALATSSNAMNHMAKLLSTAFTRNGHEVIYGRIPDPEMTAQQHASLGLDRADPKAFEIMDQLAATNEARILSSMGTPHDAVHKSFRDLFLELPNR